jgi:hypothetical protein
LRSLFILFYMGNWCPVTATICSSFDTHVCALIIECRIANISNSTVLWRYVWVIRQIFDVFGVISYPDTLVIKLISLPYESILAQGRTFWCSINSRFLNSSVL